MSARLARSTFASLRASTRTRTSYVLPAARRNMSAQSHASHSKKSDMPWIVGATLVFGPLFLYLLSPSARKPPAHDSHHSHQEAHTSTEEHQPEAQEPEVMKDDEGTPADVTATITLAEASDVPKDAQSPDAAAAITEAAEQAPVGEATADKTATEEAATTTGATTNETSSTSQPAKQAEPAAEKTSAKSQPPSSA